MSKASSSLRPKLPTATGIKSQPLPGDAIEAARQVCGEYAGGVRAGGGVPAVAAKLGMQVQVLYNKLSGDEDSYHKLTVADFLRIWLATGRIDHLQALARTMSCAVFPVPALAHVSDEALLDLLCKTQSEAGIYYDCVRRSLADGSITAEELAQLRVLELQWIGAICEMQQRLEGLGRG